jgi:hypothetical protein
MTLVIAIKIHKIEKKNITGYFRPDLDNLKLEITRHTNTPHRMWICKRSNVKKILIFNKRSPTQVVQVVQVVLLNESFNASRSILLFADLEGDVSRYIHLLLAKMMSIGFINFQVSFH